MATEEAGITVAAVDTMVVAAGIMAADAVWGRFTVGRPSTAPHRHIAPPRPAGPLHLAVVRP